MKSMRTPLGAILVMALLCIGLQGCPAKVGVQLLVSSETLDFGTDREELLLRVYKNYTATDMGALVVSTNQDWILIQDCQDATDECTSNGPRDAIGVRVRIDRNKLALGLNEGKIYLNAGTAAEEIVAVIADEILQADFLAEERSIAPGQPVELSDISLTTDTAGEINRWLWEFGDGAISTRQNPSHAYEKSGIYDIALTITTDQNVSRKIAKAGYVQVQKPTNLVDFVASNTNVDVNEAVNFKDISQVQGAPVISRTWDFGDGNTATALAPIHRYAESGIYTVSLTISTSGEDLRAVKENYVVVRSVSGIRADFNFNTTGGASPYASEAIQFFDTSESGRGDITSWEWDFGDDVTSDEQNPAHAYTAVGAYTVTLTVTSDYGTDTKEKSLEVVYRPPAASFDALPTVQWTQNPVKFVDMSVAGYAPIDAWRWDFGDGNTSDEQNPLHVYTTPGLYTVTLTVSSNNGVEGACEGEDAGANINCSSASFTRKDFIKIKKIPEPPNPDFSYAPRLALTEERVFFEASNSTITDEPILEYVWDFGDGEFTFGRTVSHSYAEPGRYVITLTVLTESTSASESCVAALEEFQESPGIDELHQAAEFCGVSIMRNITVDRAPSPEFTVWRRDGDGVVETNQGYTYVDTFSFTPAPQPEDARPIREYNWDFGDDSSSELAAPTHEYEAEGQYEISLTIAFRHSASLPTDPDLLRDSSSSIQVRPSIYDYVNNDDNCYVYSNPVEQAIAPEELDGMQVATAYLVESLTSQCWNPDDAVYPLIERWTHPVVIYEPVEKLSDTALLFIEGGDWYTEPTIDENMWQLAVISGTTVVHLMNVPSQPIVFNEEIIPAGEQDNNSGDDIPLRLRAEDEIIAYTYDEFITKYDATDGNVDTSWPLLFPMVKAAVKAMDMTEEILALHDIELDGFVVTGGSKRGWATWLTGAVDPRVKGISPIVTNMLNIQKTMRHHKKVYGYWAPSVYVYAQERVFERLVPMTDDVVISEGSRTLLDYIDPYEYSQRGRYPMPKFLLNATGDEFFVPDTTENYFHSLEGDAHMSFVPNVGHSMDGFQGGVIDPDLQRKNPARMLLAWYMAVSQNKPLPQFNYRFEDNGAIRVTVDPEYPPTAAYMWQATAEGARDFRNDVLGDGWSRQALTPQVGGETGAYYVTPTIVTPEEGNYTAYYIQLIYQNQAEMLPEIEEAGFSVPDLVFSSGVRVKPDEYPEFAGYVVNDNSEDQFVPTETMTFSEDKMPVIMVYGTPYEMGNYYGQLLAPKINEFIRDYITYYLSLTGVTTNDLLDAWNLVAPFMDSRIVEEMKGIADAEGITVSLQQIKMAHAAALFEVLGTTAGVATVAYGDLLEDDDSQGALAASINAQFYKDQCAIIYVPDDGVPHALFTHAGLTFGHIGMNLGGISAFEVVDLPYEDEETGVLIDPYTGEPFSFTGVEPNASFLIRTILYDALSLREAIDLVKSAFLQRPTTIMLSDGRNELRGARIKMYPGGQVLDERYDLAQSDFEINDSRGVLYGANTVLLPSLQTALADRLNPALSFEDLVIVSNTPPFAIPDANIMNTVLEGTTLTVLVNIAQEGPGGQYLDAYEDLDPLNPDDLNIFNIQTLFP